MIDINKENITNLLRDINSIKQLCKSRCLEKLDAEDRGFGEHNKVEYIEFYESEVTLQVEDSKYDLKDTCFVSINIDEICMTDEEWTEHIQKLKSEANHRKEVRKLERQREIEKLEIEKYQELKKKFG